MYIQCTLNVGILQSTVYRMYIQCTLNKGILQREVYRMYIQCTLNKGILKSEVYRMYIQCTLNRSSAVYIMYIICFLNIEILQSAFMNTSWILNKLRTFKTVIKNDHSFCSLNILSYTLVINLRYFYSYIFYNLHGFIYVF